MGVFSDILEACDALGHAATKHGIGLLDVQDDQLNGRTVNVRGAELVNFSSCSYLGLELDTRLIDGAAAAARRYGTQFSVSRAFMSAPPYAELEELLSEITGGHVVVTPNTTLASAAALPSLVGEEDAVILDHQVHMTVQQVMPLLQRMGVPVEFVRHGRLDRLEERIRALTERHRHIWFLIDGVYSMHGDLAPLDGLKWLLSRHEQLRLYVDDAHGMSWCGRNGRGYALDALEDRERVVVAISLNKSFAAGGGALVLPDEKSRRLVRHTGTPVVFSGPVQPPMLGAAIASARLHLSDEIAQLQGELLLRIHHANRKAKELDLPLLFRSQAVPIRFVGLGPSAASMAMAIHLRDRGLLPSCALFPAVPAHQTGIRFTLTRHQTLEDIDRLFEEMAEFLPAALAAGGVTREDVDRAFYLTPRRAAQRISSMDAGKLRLEHYRTVDDLDPAEWDELLGDRGSFDVGGLRYLEDTFRSGSQKEDAWAFHYYRVCDSSRAPILLTFFTEAWMKDDMFATAAISRDVERRRKDDPYFLTSQVVTMGSPLTEGNHLYLDRNADWQSALRLLVSHISNLAEDSNARLVALRDLPADDSEVESALSELGFVRMSAPDAMQLALDWQSRDEYLGRLTKRARRFQREEVEPHSNDYDVRVWQPDGPQMSDAQWLHLYELYRNVWKRSFHLNTFALPERFLRNMLSHRGWEIVTLTFRDADDGLPQAFFAARVTPHDYVPLVVGLDYRYVREHGAYRQCLAHMLRRGKELDRRQVHLGMGAAMEKRRFAAKAVKSDVWVQARDHFHTDVLTLLMGDMRSSGS